MLCAIRGLVVGDAHLCVQADVKVDNTTKPRMYVRGSGYATASIVLELSCLLHLVMHLGRHVKCRFTSTDSLVFFALPCCLLRDLQIERNVELAAGLERLLDVLAWDHA